MRRKDREVTDAAEILRIIEQCDVLRIGLADGDYPYIVPVNFAFAQREGKLLFFVHGAVDGRKHGLMQRNRCCTFELDRTERILCDGQRGTATTHYQSVMGKAKITFPEGAEKQSALALLMDRYPETRGIAPDPALAEHTAVMVLAVTELSAKENPRRH